MLEKKILERPDISKIDKNDLIDKFIKANNYYEYTNKTSVPEYLFWNKVKYLKRPDDCTAVEFWAFIKLLRKFSASRVKSQVMSDTEELFSWERLPEADSFYHEVTQQCSGNLRLTSITSEKQKQYYMSKGVMEEAIASSQLEGAVVTRKVAKKMIREGRKPTNKSEQMILNNYNTIVYIEQQFKNEKLSVEKLCELQGMLTKKTLSDEGEIGRYRRDEDEIVVINEEDGLVYHIPPNEKFLEREIIRLIQYANDEINDYRFVHPVTKAIIIHFWIGYLHPFCDGNGRLARALFYWYLLKHDYWVFSYLPLSKIIKESPAQYRNAYIYTEQDDLDLTYFIDYNIRKIKQAMKEFENYIDRKQEENRKLNSLFHAKYNFNDRQINLIKYLYSNFDEYTTISTHSKINNVSLVTARKDLQELKDAKFLVTQKRGKYVNYHATEKVNELFE